MKHLFLPLSFFSLFLTVACNKDACIEGKVTDAKTGKPVPGATIILAYTASERGSAVHHSETVTSDESGEFSFTAGEKYAETVGVAAVLKTGYSNVYKELHDAKDKGCSNSEVKMTPLDGLLDLTIRNETGLHDTIIVHVFNRCEYEYQTSYHGVRGTTPEILTLSKGMTQVESIPLCVGDSTAIQWRFTKYGPWFHTDSLLVKTTSTTPFTITY